MTERQHERTHMGWEIAGLAVANVAFAVGSWLLFDAVTCSDPTTGWCKAAMDNPPWTILAAPAAGPAVLWTWYWRRLAKAIDQEIEDRKAHTEARREFFTRARTAMNDLNDETPAVAYAGVSLVLELQAEPRCPQTIKDVAGSALLARYKADNNKPESARILNVEAIRDLPGFIDLLMRHDQLGKVSKTRVNEVLSTEVSESPTPAESQPSHSSQSDPDPGSEGGSSAS